LDLIADITSPRYAGGTATFGLKLGSKDVGDDPIKMKRLDYETTLSNQ